MGASIDFLNRSAQEEAPGALLVAAPGTDPLCPAPDPFVTGCCASTAPLVALVAEEATPALTALLAPMPAPLAVLAATAANEDPPLPHTPIRRVGSACVGCGWSLWGVSRSISADAEEATPPVLSRLVEAFVRPPLLEMEGAPNPGHCCEVSEGAADESGDSDAPPHGAADRCDALAGCVSERAPSTDERSVVLLPEPAFRAPDVPRGFDCPSPSETTRVTGLAPAAASAAARGGPPVEAKRAPLALLLLLLPTLPAPGRLADGSGSCSVFRLPLALRLTTTFHTSVATASVGGSFSEVVEVPFEVAAGPAPNRGASGFASPADEPSFPSVGPAAANDVSFEETESSRLTLMGSSLEAESVLADAETAAAAAELST